MEKYGQDFVVVGCSSSPTMANDEDGVVTLKKWLVDVQCEGCRGLYYRSAPNVIVPDADWPKNGDVIIGSEIPDIPGMSSLPLAPVGLSFVISQNNVTLSYY